MAPTRVVIIPVASLPAATPEADVVVAAVVPDVEVLVLVVGLGTVLGKRGN